MEAALDPGSPLWLDTGDYTGSSTTDDNMQDVDDAEIANEEDEVAAKMAAVSSQAVTLSMRQIIRAARRAATANFEESTEDERAEDIGNSLEAALMTEFMPRAERASVREILRSVGLGGGSRKLRIAAAGSMEIVEADFDAADPKIIIGDVTCPVYSPKEPALPPVLTDTLTPIAFFSAPDIISFILAAALSLNLITGFIINLAPTWQHLTSYLCSMVGPKLVEDLHHQFLPLASLLL